MKKKIIISTTITSIILIIFIALNLLLAFANPIIWLRYSDKNNNYLSFHKNFTVTVYVNDNKEIAPYYITNKNEILISDILASRGIYSYTITKNNNTNNKNEYICYPAWTFQILLILGYTICATAYAIIIIYGTVNKKDSK